MAVVVLLLTWACAAGITTTASRMTWSFARDNGLPASKWLSKVDRRTKVPAIACLVVTTIAALLTLINIGSSVAFNDVISLTITGFYGSYLLPSILLLYHRVKGNILPHNAAMDTTTTTIPPAPTTNDQGTTVNIPSDGPTKFPAEKDIRSKSPSSSNGHDNNVDHAHGTILASARLIWGPWHLPGLLGTLNNAYAVLYMIFVIFWSVWPPDAQVTASTMNYSVVVTGGVAILSAVWYFVRARKVYRGPTVDEEVVGAVRRAGSVVSV